MVFPSRAAVALVALTTAACFASLDGYSGGAPSDAGAPEGGDAASPTVAPSGDASAPFCATVSPSPFLCDDFDGPPLTAIWDGVVADKGGAVHVDDLDAVSKPRSLLSTTPSSEGNANACLRRSLLGAHTDLSVEASLLVEDRSSTPYDFFTFDHDDQHELGVEVHEDGSLVFDEDRPGDGGETEVKTPTGALLPPRWARVAIVVHVEPTRALAQVLVDGQLAGQTEARPDAVAQTTTVELGDCTLYTPAGAKSGWRVRFDDVVVTAK